MLAPDTRFTHLRTQPTLFSDQGRDNARAQSPDDTFLTNHDSHKGDSQRKKGTVH